MVLMGYNEAAQFLKISPGTLRNWVSQKRITPYKIGKHVIFARDELENWIKTPSNHTVKPKKPKEKEWTPKLNVTFANKKKDPYVLLLNLPSPNVKMTPDNLRELARYLVDAAGLCERTKMKGLTNFPIMKENEKFRSSVVLVPFNQMRDLQELEKVDQLTSEEFPVCRKERYVEIFIDTGLKKELKRLNRLLTAKGKRKISFKSLMPNF